MIVELLEVNKTYNPGEANEVRAVKDISLTVTKGNLVCLRGPSGSGKTTILSIIGCLFPPTSGHAAIMGKKVSRLPDHFLSLYRRTIIGFIFQHYNLLPELSVVENIVLPLYPLGYSPKERVQLAEPLLERFGIAHRRDFLTADLSGGEMQRVAICRALIHDPPLLLADEPTAHLDTQMAEQFMSFLVELKDEGKTIVLTSHDPRVCLHPCVDQLHDVADGRINTTVAQEQQ